MAVTVANAAHGTTRNNGGTVFNGGNVGSGQAITNAPGTSIVNHHSGVHGSAPVSSATANIGTIKAYSAGTFAYTMEAGKFLVRRASGYINGIANSLLNSGCSDFGRRSIHYIEGTYRYNVTSWDYVTGAATKGVNAGDSVSFGNDDAARPSMAVPGEFVYNYGLNTVQADYSAKTSG